MRLIFLLYTIFRFLVLTTFGKENQSQVSYPDLNNTDPFEEIALNDMELMKRSVIIPNNQIETPPLQKEFSNPIIHNDPDSNTNRDVQTQIKYEKIDLSNLKRLLETGKPIPTNYFLFDSYKKSVNFYELANFSISLLDKNSTTQFKLIKMHNFLEFIFRRFSAIFNFINPKNKVVNNILFLEKAKKDLIDRLKVLSSLNFDMLDRNIHGGFFAIAEKHLKAVPLLFSIMEDPRAKHNYLELNISGTHFKINTYCPPLDNFNIHVITFSHLEKFQVVEFLFHLKMNHYINNFVNHVESEMRFHSPRMNGTFESERIFKFKVALNDIIYQMNQKGIEMTEKELSICNSKVHRLKNGSFTDVLTKKIQHIFILCKIPF